MVTKVEATCVHSRLGVEEGKRCRMCGWQKLLSFLAVLLACISVTEVGYFAYVVVKHRQEFSASDCTITSFINFSSVFFSAALVAGIVQSNEALITTWSVYAVIELFRSSFILCDSWNEAKNFESHERIITTCDASLQAVHITVVLLLLNILKSDRRRHVKSLNILSITQTLNGQQLNKT